MADDDQKNVDEFLRAIVGDGAGSPANGFKADEEIIFKDRDGKIKVLKNGQVSELKPEKEAAGQAVARKPEVKTEPIEPIVPAGPAFQPATLEKEIDQIVKLRA